METISLSSSPAALIASDAAEDGDDEAAPVKFHEAASDGGDDDEPEPEQLSPEDKLLRRQLLRRIARYRALFPGEISDINVSNLDSLSLEKLRDLEQDVSFLVATRRSAKACRSLFIGSLQGLEAVALRGDGSERTGKLRGFVRRFANDMRRGGRTLRIFDRNRPPR